MMLLLQAGPPAWLSLDPAVTDDVAGGFLICLLTLAIFSFLYRDNPFYKFAEHLFIGVGTAWFTMEFYDSGVLGPLIRYFQDIGARGAEAAAAPAAVELGGYPVAVG